MALMCNQSARRQWTENPTNCLLGFQHRIPLFSNSNLKVICKVRAKLFLWVKDVHQPCAAIADPSPTTHLPRSSSFTTIAASLCNSSSSSKDFNADLFKKTCVQLLKMNSDDALWCNYYILIQSTSKLWLRKILNICETPWRNQSSLSLSHTWFRATAGRFAEDLPSETAPGTAMADQKHPHRLSIMCTHANTLVLTDNLSLSSPWRMSKNQASGSAGHLARHCRSICSASSFSPCMHWQNYFPTLHIWPMTVWCHNSHSWTKEPQFLKRGISIPCEQLATIWAQVTWCHHMSQEFDKRLSTISGSTYH